MTELYTGTTLLFDEKEIKHKSVFAISFDIEGERYSANLDVESAIELAIELLTFANGKETV